MKRSHLAIGLILLVLIIDQSLKIWVKLNMEMGESFNVFGTGQEWFQILFTENPGMAFGFEFGGDYGKLFLSLFRIVAVSFITYYLYILVKQKKSFGLIASISLIWAGAVGNILDSAFYGLLFTNSHHAGGVATWASSGDGYATFLHGRVVDMLYFPLVEGHYPNWMPFLGGKYFKFFQPIFNIADASISMGVVMIILFYQRFFKDLSKPQKQDDADQDDGDSTDVVGNESESLEEGGNENVLTDNVIEETELEINVNIKHRKKNKAKTDEEEKEDHLKSFHPPLEPTDSNLNEEEGLDIPLDEEEKF